MTCVCLGFTVVVTDKGKGMEWKYRGLCGVLKIVL